MQCPNCWSDNVMVQMEQVGSRTTKKGNGIGGHINNAARATAALCTLGMSNLVWKKSKGNERTQYINRKVCICQNCGYNWYE